jgi:U4/U6 small nuclear ribonucleoprotein PRP4
LIQEGHSGPVYPLSFHKDGSLIASGDLHGIGQLWDLRTGKNILSFQGHQGNQLISMQFMPTGYHIATGGDDNTVKIWDLRKKTNITTIPAHNKLISDIKFENTAQSRLMLTASYDQKCKIWGTKSIVSGENTGDEWVLLRTLSGHENKVTSICHTSDFKYIITTSFDKTFKLWS